LLHPDPPLLPCGHPVRCLYVKGGAHRLEGFKQELVVTCV